MALENLETETITENPENSLETEAVLAGVDEVYDVVRECLDAAEQALQEGDKSQYNKQIEEAGAAWEFFSNQVNQNLPSGSTIRDEALNYCGDLSLMIDGDIASMDERWGEAGQNVQTKEVAQLLNLDTARKNYAAAKIKVEGLRGIKNLLTLGPSRDRVVQELAAAENNYQKARAEYLGANIGKFLQEKINFTEAELNSYTT